MTVHEVFSALALVLSVITFLMVWTSETARRIDQGVTDESIEDLYRHAGAQYQASSNAFGATDERIDALEEALDEKFDDVDAELHEHDESLNGAAADMVLTQDLVTKLFRYVHAVHMLTKTIQTQDPLGWKQS
jgi:hypothetical protein